MRKYLLFIATIFIVSIAFLFFNHYFYQDAFYFLKGSINIEKISTVGDKDKDGINDFDDILKGARQEVTNRTNYKSTYYKGGYPPAGEGVCTDVIWRAFKSAGFDVKAMIDKDIKENLKDYSESIIKPDPNIDFRRVKNQYIFLKKYAVSLTIDVKPYDKSNLYQWQRGDIVIVGKSEHIAIVSDKRRKDGVPYIIHNAYSYAKEENKLAFWGKTNRILGHFRYPKKNE